MEASEEGEQLADHGARASGPSERRRLHPSGPLCICCDGPTPVRSLFSHIDEAEGEQEEASDQRREEIDHAGEEDDLRNCPGEQQRAQRLAGRPGALGEVL